MTQKTNLISCYAPTVDLRHLAATFNERQKDLKTKEKELIYSALNEEFFRIKQKALDIIIENYALYNPDNRCNLCFTKKEEYNKMENYYVNVLNINQLFYVRNKNQYKLKCLGVFSFKCERNIDCSLHRNEELNEFVKEIISKSEVIYQNKIVNWLKKTVNILRCKFSSIIFKFLGFYLYFKMSNFFEKLIISSAELDSLKNIGNKNLPVVYILKHNYLLEHVFTSFILYFCGLKPPIIFYNQDEEPAFKWIFQKLGVIFVKFPTEDTMKKIVYDEVLQLFIEENLKLKNHLLFSLSTISMEKEQGNNVFLKTAVSSLKRNPDQDILFVPVNINYEKMYSKLFFLKQTKNSIFHFLNVYRKSVFNFGFTRITFGFPFSLKNMINANEENSSRNISWDSPDFDSHTFSISNKIALHMTYDFSSSNVLMSTNMICFLLLKKFRNGINYSELIEEIDKFREQWNQPKKRLGFSGKSENIINHVVKLLGPELIHVKTDSVKIIEPILKLPNVLELSHYSTIFVNYIIWDSIVFTCLYVLFKHDLEEEASNIEGKILKFSYNRLIETIEELCDILQFEFVLQKPCYPRSSIINDIFFEFVSNDVFIKDEKLLTEQEKWGHKYAKHLEYSDSEDSEDDYDDYNNFNQASPYDSGDSYTVNFNNGKLLREKILFHKNVLKSVIDAYVVSAENIFTLAKEVITDMEYCKQLSEIMEVLLQEKKLIFPESVSQNIIYNSINLFEKWHIIEKDNLNGTIIIYISDNSNPENISYFIDKIKRFV